MTTLKGKFFVAECKPSGDVWITRRLFNSQVMITISQESREALSKLLWPDVESDEEWTPNYNRPPYKVDYNTRPWEPE